MKELLIEDKQLLFQDLCARLPYHPKGHVVNACNGAKCDEWLTCATFTMFTNITNNSRLYLRPMSSMTKEEKEEIAFIRDRDFQSVRKWIHDESIKETGNICPITCGEIDYCNKKHLDYRGLIEKGLAIEAPEGMYK